MKSSSEIYVPQRTTTWPLSVTPTSRLNFPSYTQNVSGTSALKFPEDVFSFFHGTTDKDCRWNQQNNSILSHFLVRELNQVPDIWGNNIEIQKCYIFDSQSDLNASKIRKNTFQAAVIDSGSQIRYVCRCLGLQWTSVTCLDWTIQSSGSERCLVSHDVSLIKEVSEVRGEEFKIVAGFHARLSARWTNTVWILCDNASPPVTGVEFVLAQKCLVFWLQSSADPQRLFLRRAALKFYDRELWCVVGRPGDEDMSEREDRVACWTDWDDSFSYTQVE